MIRVRLVHVSYLAYQYLEYLQTVRGGLRSVQILKVVQGQSDHGLQFAKACVDQGIYCLSKFLAN